MKKLKIRKWWLWAAALLLAAGHWLFWYQPRARSATPDMGGFPARWLLDDQFPSAAWIPFPHQNLGALGREGASPQDLSSAIARLSEVEAPTLPRFGPFTAPPSRELLLAVDGEDKRFLMAARVYPGLAVFARLAGRMAGNPWLGGGIIELADGRVEIRWEGTLWSARTSRAGQVPEPSPGELSVPADLRNVLNQPSLSLARTDGRLGYLPAGWYRLAADKEILRMSKLRTSLEGSASAESEGSQQGVGSLDEFFLEPLLSESVALVAFKDRGLDERQALALFASESGATNTGFALLSASPARKLPMTGLGLAVLLGDQGYSGIASGWSLLATSELSFRQGAFLVPPVRDGLAGHRQRGEPLELGLAAQPEAVLEVLRELTDRLATLGPLGHDEHARLMALRDLLTPLATYSRARFAVASDRRTAVLELVP